MTGREILLRAIAGEATERVPWVPFCGVHSASLIGVTAKEYLRSADRIVEGQEKAIELYRPDGLPVVFDLQIEAEVLGCELHWSDDNPPAVIKHPLETSEVPLPELVVPAADAGRVPVTLEATRRLREAHPELGLYGLVTGPFTLALHLRGTPIFIDMFDRPEWVDELLAFCSEVGCRMADHYVDAGCDVIAVVDPMTSQIGPDQFRRFCREPATAIFEHVRERKRHSSFFVCGHAQRNIEAMCECRCDNVSIDENIPLDYVRDICRERGISFGGNLQLTVVLLTGTREDCLRNALECLDVGGSEGYILSPGCDIPFATPVDNLQAVAEVVHEEYARQVARQLLAQPTESGVAPADMSDYGRSDRIIVDVITLDSEGCAPCQYMVESVQEVAPQFEGLVEWREHKIKYRDSIDFMSSLMVRNIPTICIDGRIAFVSRIPPREDLIEAIQRRVNEKMKIRIQRQTRTIRIFGPPTPECIELRDNVRRAIRELGANVRLEEVEDEAQWLPFGIQQTPAVAIERQWIKSSGTVPATVVIKEWLKQLEE